MLFSVCHFLKIFSHNRSSYASQMTIYVKIRRALKQELYKKQTKDNRSNIRVIRGQLYWFISESRVKMLKVTI